MTDSKQYNLRIKKSVRKQLLKLQPKFFKQVMSKILSLTDNPRSQNIKLYRDIQIIIELIEENLGLFMKLGRKKLKLFGLVSVMMMKFIRT